MASPDSWWSTLKMIKFCRIHYLFYWVDRKGGGGVLHILISEAEEEDGVLIVDLNGFKAYNVKSPSNIWTKFGTWLPLTLCVPPSKAENYVLSIFYFIEWTAKGGGGGSNCNLKFWIVKRENMNESSPTGIEVHKISEPNLVHEAQKRRRSFE